MLTGVFLISPYWGVDNKWRLMKGYTVIVGCIVIIREAMRTRATACNACNMYTYLHSFEIARISAGVVNGMDLKSIGPCPRRFESYLIRVLRGDILMLNYLIFHFATSLPTFIYILRSLCYQFFRIVVLFLQNAVRRLLRASCKNQTRKTSPQSQVPAEVQSFIH